VGKKNLEQAMAKRKDIKFNVTWRPFFLNSSIPQGGVPLRTYLGAMYGSKRFEVMSQHLHDKGKEVGINFKEDRWIVPTLNSHRLLEFALRISVEKQNEVIDKIFSQYFEDGKNISDIDVLVSIAESCNIQGAREYLNTEQDKQSVIDQDNQWKKSRIGGVPFFSISASGMKRKLNLSGAQPAEFFLDAFEELVEK